MIGVRQSGAYIATYVPPVLRRISWPAVGAGVGVALLIQLVLSIHVHLHQWLMGVGVGIGPMDPTRIKTLATADLGGIPGLCWQSLGLIALLTLFLERAGAPKVEKRGQSQRAGVSSGAGWGRTNTRAQIDGTSLGPRNA